MNYELLITLGDVEPPIWRRLQVPAEISLEELHRVLQLAMGWSDSHLHQFEVGGELIGPPSVESGPPSTDEGQVRLVDVALDKTRFWYVYDFGDDWRHQVVVDRVIRDGEPQVRCLDGARACPPEDCGGWAGYDELLEILSDPTHPEHAERLARVGGAFDPEAFDVGEIDERLQRRGSQASDEPLEPSTLLH